MKKIYNINEIFYSIQGEGHLSGTPSIFIRFCKCNLSCSFCDTEFDAINFQFDKLELENYVKDNFLKDLYFKPNIIFTGGEPTLQLNESEVLFRDFFTCIESNGSKKIPSWIKWICISPKIKTLNMEILNQANEIKILYGIFEIEYILELQKLRPDIPFYIQPIDNGILNENLEILIDFIKKYPHFRLSLQIHKMINVR